MDSLQRGLQETDQLYRAALAENRGLRKRLKTERECVRGLLKGLVDPQAMDRFIAHLDLLVGKAEAAAPSNDGTQGEPAEHVAEPAGDLVEIFLALEQIARNLDAARKETPDVQDAAFANSAHHVRMVAERLAKQSEQSKAVTVDPETVALLRELPNYLDALVNGKHHNMQTYVRLRDACEAAFTRLRAQSPRHPRSSR